MLIIAIELGLLVSQSPSLKTPSQVGWVVGELRAHVLLRNARLLWFDRGVSRPRRPIVGLTKSTFGCFCDGSKDFLSYHGYFRKFTQLRAHKMLKSVYIALMQFVPPLIINNKS